MSLPRTTKRAALARRLAGCALVFGMLAMPAYALNVRLESTDPIDAPLPHYQIGIIGQAPSTCRPSIQRTSFNGPDIGIELHVPKTGCPDRRASNYALRVDPVEAGAPLAPGQVYRVSVFSDAGDSPGMIAFRLLDTSAPGSGTPQPENGFWWSEASIEAGPASRSTGMSLEAQGDQLAVNLFGFSDDGNPVWYFGSARQKGRTTVVPLLELRNGDPLFSPTGSRPRAIDGLRLELEFLSPSRARAWLVRSDDRRDIAVRAFALSRSSFANGEAGADWSGRWVLVGEDETTLRQFEFARPTRQDANTFHFLDADGASLDCRRSPLATIPDLCTLSLGASTIADFNQVGLDRLDGRDAHGARVRLLRVTRP
ncbi:MAG: hypothetical protein ACTHK2_15305 [Dokdonella sp.]|uniref:hypothetical protein n=1 Tax=Dokdonella sp. TaxID=2291710 RepID=UPI003F7DA657